MILTRSLPAATYSASWPRHISLRLGLVAHQIRCCRLPHCMGASLATRTHSARVGE
jgi:hypothetical protein